MFGKKQAKSKAPKAAAKPKAKAPKRRGRGVLAVIGALLVGSAVVRGAIGATEALAKEDSPEQVIQAAAPAPAPEVKPQADIASILKALKSRETRIAKREEDLEIRMRALTVAEEEIERKLVELEAAERSLRETLALAQTAAEEDIDKLTNVYASMKPKQAAALFETMDPDFAAGFLARMRPDAAALIMAGLTPETAYLVSVVLAGRNADVPRE